MAVKQCEGNLHSCPHLRRLHCGPEEFPIPALLNKAMNIADYAVLGVLAAVLLLIALVALAWRKP